MKRVWKTIIPEVALQPVSAGTTPRGRSPIDNLQTVLVVIALLFAALSAVGQTNSPRSIRVVMDDNYPPYVFKDHEGNLQGALIDEWRLWETKTGIKVEIHAMDWAEALHRMEAGEFDVIDTIFKTEARAALFDFSKPHAQIEVPIFFQREISGITDLKSLKGFPVAAKAGDAAVDMLKQNGIDSILLFKNYESLIEAAQQQKVHVFVVDAPPALYFLNKLNIAHNFRRSSPVSIGEFHRAVKKDNAALLETVEAGFANISAAELKTIEDRWWGTPVISGRYLRYLGYAAGGAILLVLILAAWNRALSREAKKQALAMRENDVQFRLIMENLADMVAVIDLNGNRIYNSPSYRPILGDPETLRGSSSFAEIHPDDRERVQQAFRDTLKTGNGHRLEYRLLDRLGQTRQIESQGSSIRDHQGQVTKIVVVSRDVTDRKYAELRIQYLNRVHAMLSAINQTIVRVNDPRELFTAACQIAVEKGGFPMAWIGLVNGQPERVDLVAHAGASAETLAVLNSVLRTAPEPCGCSFTFQALQTGRHAVCNNIAHDPKAALWREAALQHHFQAMASLPLTSGNAVIGTFNIYAGEPDAFDERELRLLAGMASDISFAMEIGRRETERRQAEAELRWKTALFEAEVDASLDGILVVDSQGRKIIQNQRMNELFKIPLHLAENKDDDQQRRFVANRMKNPAQFNEKVDYLNSHPDEISRDELELVDGTIVDRYSSPVRDKAGTYYGRIWTFRDITEHRKLEEQFRQSQKMEAIGQLSGGIAHDFNNILAVILGYASMLMMGGLSAERQNDALDQIAQAAERAANLTRQLLAFSRRQVMSPRPLDVNEVTAGLTKMLRRLIGENIVLKTIYLPEGAPIHADPGMIEQVLLNLVVNARDALPTGGTIYIETGRLQIDEARARQHPNERPGDFVSLRVRDTGCGISPEHLPHIFEPFFTTKGAGKGTGLGLATVFGIVKQHDGWIDVKSEIGIGTTFDIYFPRQAKPSVPLIDDPAKAVSRGGHETILVVEDEPSLRALARNALERYGYCVHEAPSGKAALEVWQQLHGAVDLLLTDMVMPEGVSGRELAERLQADKPLLKIIYMSGYPGDVAGPDLFLQAGVNFLQKPFSPLKLAETVRAVLDDR